MSDQDRYSGLSTINHWVSALLVTVMLALGYAVLAAPTEAVEDYVLGIHISLGFFAFLVVAWRAGYRLYEGFPETTGDSALQRWAAYLNHRAVLILLAVLVVTGPMYLFTENEGMNVFGWFTVYLPLESLSFIHEPMEWLHVYGAVYVLPALLVLHLLGAIRHYLTGRKRSTVADL